MGKEPKETKIDISQVYTTQKQKPTPADIPCFSCGALVHVMLPFYGCVYCRDCMSPKKQFTLIGKPQIDIKIKLPAKRD